LELVEEVKMKGNIKKAFPGYSRARNRGFTLVEVLVAVIILAIGVVAVSQLTVMGMRASTVMNRRMYARDVLNRRHEILMGLPTNDPLLVYQSSTSLNDTVAPDHQLADTTHGGMYRVMWNIADSTISGAADTRFKTVRIIILWPQSRRPFMSDLIKRY
jgi:prepilin-type N-terminal cleavage/methylation domain-containing protein